MVDGDAFGRIGVDAIGCGRDDLERTAGAVRGVRVDGYGVAADELDATNTRRRRDVLVEIVDIEDRDNARVEIGAAGNAVGLVTLTERAEKRSLHPSGAAITSRPAPSMSAPAATVPRSAARQDGMARHVKLAYAGPRSGIHLMTELSEALLFFFIEPVLSHFPVPTPLIQEFKTSACL